MSPIVNSPMFLGGLKQVNNAGKDNSRNPRDRNNPFNGQSGVQNPFQSSARQILSQIAPFNFSVQA